MGADCVIVRHPASGAAHRLAAWVDKDRERRGHARPSSSTRATAPTSTPRRRCWTRPRCATGSAAIAGKRVGIVGDVLHSRVARSNVFLLATLGAEVVLVAPPTLLPVGVAQWPCRVSPSSTPSCPRWTR
jgi:aspartate carbamoyltransferase catalytic subunit